MSRGLSEEQKAKMVTAANQGKAVTQIAKELGSTFSTVKKVLTEAGVYEGKRREKGDGIGIGTFKGSMITLSKDNAFARLAVAEEKLKAVKRQLVDLQSLQKSLENEIALLLEERGLSVKPDKKK